MGHAVDVTPATLTVQLSSTESGMFDTKRPASTVFEPRNFVGGSCFP